jgi:hypothetical protein
MSHRSGSLDTADEYMMAAGALVSSCSIYVLLLYGGIIISSTHRSVV